MRQRAPTGAGDPIRGGLGSFDVATVDDHTGAVLRQQRRDGCADTPRPTDHDSAAVGEQWAHSSVPNVIASRFQ